MQRHTVRAVIVVGCLLAALSAAVPASAATSYPTADGRWAVGKAAIGRIVLCRAPAGSATGSPGVPWVRGRTWVRTRRPIVDGALHRADAAFSLTAASGTRRIAGNGLPVGTMLGTFPVSRNDDAARYAAGATAPAPQILRGTVPTSPVSRSKPGCMGLTTPIGVAVNGVPILPALRADGTGAVSREVVDRCSGRTDADGRYYYRATLRCLDKPVKGTSPVVGWARDGYPIVGMRERGRLLRNTDLDRCHGHSGTVRIGGRSVRTYQYNLTAEPPYAIGCFRARASKDWIIEPAPKTLSVTTTPALVPAFSPSVHDYVSRCGTGGLPISVAAPDGVSVSVDGAVARPGRFAVTVPVASGQGTTIVITGCSAAGTYRVRCLPPDFPAYTAKRTGTPQAAYEVITPSLGTEGRNYVAVFDRDGVPVWWMNTGDIVPIDAKLLPDGNLTWGTQVPYGSHTDHGFEERRLDGTLAHLWKTVGETTDPHDIQPLANGNKLLLSYPLREHVDLTSIFAPADSLVADAGVQEVAPNGSLVWSWNSAGQIATTESGRLSTLTTAEDGTPLYDLVHINAVEPDGNLILISAATWTLCTRSTRPPARWSGSSAGRRPRRASARLVAQSPRHGRSLRHQSVLVAHFGSHAAAMCRRGARRRVGRSQRARCASRRPGLAGTTAHGGATGTPSP